MLKSLIITFLFSVFAIQFYSCEWKPDPEELGIDTTNVDNQFGVGLLYGLSGPADGGLNQQAQNVIMKLRAVHSFELEAVSIFGENERYSIVSGMANSPDKDLIIGVGPEFSSVLDTMARLHPDKKFICLDYYSVNFDNMPPNLFGIRFADDKAAVLAGVMAGMVTKTNKVGFIGGDNSTRIQGIVKEYRNGVSSVNGNATVSVMYVDTNIMGYKDEQKGIKLADSLYKSGVDIIYHTAGVSGVGVIKSAEKNSKYAIGFGRDESFIAPGAVVGSIEKYCNTYLSDAVEKAILGNFKGGILIIGIGDGAIGYRLNENTKIPLDNLRKKT